MHGKILDIQVKCNPDYNPVPGNRIEHISFKDIFYMGQGEEKSCICGYDANHMVFDVTIENLCLCGKRAETLEEAGIKVGTYAENICIR